MAGKPIAPGDTGLKVWNPDTDALEDYPVPPNARARLLAGAEAAVNGDRNAQYGDPVRDFRRTAEFWTTYIKGIIDRQMSQATDFHEPFDWHLDPHDVAAMQDLLKLSRICWEPGKMDSWMDLAGYAACGWDCVEHDA